MVAAVASWLDAKVHGGKWLVRMEDLDPPREVKQVRQTTFCARWRDLDSHGTAPWCTRASVMKCIARLWMIWSSQALPLVARAPEKCWRMRTDWKCIPVLS